MAQLALFSLLLALGPAGTTQSDRAPAVTLGISVSEAGKSIEVPLTLGSSDPSAKLRQLRAEISFSKTHISFVGTELGLAGEISAAHLQAEIQPEDPDSEVIRLEIAILGSQELMPGILAYLQFQVSENAQEGEIPLKLENLEGFSTQSEPMPVEAGEEGKIIVVGGGGEPVFACFFFMH